MSKRKAKSAATTSHENQRLIRLWVPLALHRQIVSRAQKSRRTIQAQTLVDLEQFYGKQSSETE
jgi:hypothetical protein